MTQELFRGFFLARFNHKLDELQACRQELVQILDQKLAKQGLPVVSRDILRPLRRTVILLIRDTFLIVGKCSVAFKENGGCHVCA